uniref:Uncharacterized protein n=1 Tax=Acidobacterium capsulatum TaxID=33075 RepID=A0A7V4XU44_9BACT
MKWTGKLASSDEAKQLYQELWISLVALVQSYTAAALLAVPEESFEYSREADDECIFRAKHKQLLLWRSGTAGDGSWEVRSSAEETLAKGRFSLNEQGLVSVDGSPSMEMDAAAEILAAKIL